MIPLEEDSHYQVSFLEGVVGELNALGVAVRLRIPAQFYHKDDVPMISSERPLTPEEKKVFQDNGYALKEVEFPFK